MHLLAFAGATHVLLLHFAQQLHCDSLSRDIVDCNEQFAEALGDCRFGVVSAGKSGFVASSGYPSKYSSNTRQRWAFANPVATPTAHDDLVLSVKFIAPFNLESNAMGICFDDLRIIRVNSTDANALPPVCEFGTADELTSHVTFLHRFCGDSLPEDLKLDLVSGHAIAIDFCTDLTTEMTGFKLQWKIHAGLKAPPRALAEASSICGKPNIIPSHLSRIIGGDTATPHSWPWIAAIFRQPANMIGSYHMCGGTLISQDWIVTAAHCLHGNDKDTFYVKLGAHDKGPSRTINEPSQQLFAVEKRIFHPKYDTVNVSYDISLLKLNRRASFNNFVKPMCLPNETDTLLTAFDQLVVAGWGVTKEGSVYGNRVLLQTVLPYISFSKCNELYDGQIDETMICAGHMQGGRDACQGDSGGPLMQQRANGEWTLRGIVSWGLYGTCGRPDIPGVYSNVAFLRDWIDETVADNS